MTLQSERAVNAVAPARRENGGAAFDATLNDIVVQSLTRTQPETEHTVSVGKAPELARWRRQKFGSRPY